MKICIACGIPMEQESDFAMGDDDLDYCVHCANEDGSMHSFEQTKAGMTAVAAKMHGLDPTAAEKVALSMMGKLPAWEKHFQN
ncbi:MAG: zinc ribbon domain-containing protein [Actinomycetia bacterium]|nr:zinc ribbon domain-containing protein [Actinomycetes bacterium]